MKLALYLPNFRDKVTVSEIVDLAHLAEQLEFDSIWTLDRIVVPEASDRQELRKPFGFMKEFPHSLPVAARGEFLHGLPLIPYLAAITKKVRVGVSVIDTPYRAPGVLAAEIATWDHLSGGRVNVGVGTGWMPEEFEAASAAHIYERRNKHVLETIEIMQGVWTQELFEYHGEFASFPKCGFGVKPVQKPHPPIFFGGLGRTEDRGEASCQIRVSWLDRNTGHSRRHREMAVGDQRGTRNNRRVHAPSTISKSRACSSSTSRARRRIRLLEGN